MTRLQRLKERILSRLPYLNILLVAAAWTGNQLVQVFCQPVVWAGVVLLFTTAAFLIWPWLARAPRPIQYMALLAQGMGLLVCIYRAWFIGWWAPLAATLFALPLLLWPLLCWVPLLVGAQLLKRGWQSRTGGRIAFVIGFLTLLPVQWWVETEYQHVEQIARRLQQQRKLTVRNLAQSLPRSYVAERIVGMYFRYHSRAELVYDGFRPPLHDPLVNVCYHLRSFRDPLTTDPRRLNRVMLYKLMFPEKPVKADCVCAYNRDGLSYRDWQPTDAIIAPVY